MIVFCLQENVHMIGHLQNVLFFTLILSLSSYSFVFFFPFLLFYPPQFRISLQMQSLTLRHFYLFPCQIHIR